MLFAIFLNIIPSVGWENLHLKHTEQTRDMVGLIQIY